jgi:hypothetical protein
MPAPMMIEHFPSVFSASGVAEHSTRPPVDVELPDDGPHRRHAFLLLVLVHGERRGQGRARLFEVVRIDDQCFT